MEPLEVGRAAEEVGREFCALPSVLIDMEVARTGVILVALAVDKLRVCVLWEAAAAGDDGLSWLSSPSRSLKE